MPLLHQFLLNKTDWYEACLAQQAQELGYLYIPPSVVQLLRHMVRDVPARIALLAQRIGVTRRRISQIAAEGVKLGVLELIEDPGDKRVLLVQLSPGGKRLADATVATMHRIDAELARRIGRRQLDTLIELLAMDWGPVVTNAASPAPAQNEASPRRRVPRAKTAAAPTPPQRPAAARKRA